MISVNEVLENDGVNIPVIGNTEQIENIYPADIRRHSFRSKDRSAVITMQRLAESICRVSIGEEYIRSSFNNFKGGFIYTRRGAPKAFIIWKIRETKRSTKGGVYRGPPTRELHILLVCAQKSEFPFLSLMMKDVESYCVESGIEVISLYPANDALRALYKQYGFLENTSLTDKDIMVKPAAVQALTRISRSHTRRRGRRSGT